MAAEHCVYTLFKDGELIYIGSSKDITTRVKRHQKEKDFDTCLIISTHETRKQAYEAEKCLIKFTDKVCCFPNLTNMEHSVMFDKDRIKPCNFYKSAEIRIIK